MTFYPKNQKILFRIYHITRERTRERIKIYSQGMAGMIKDWGANWEKEEWYVEWILELMNLYETIDICEDKLRGLLD